MVSAIRARSSAIAAVAWRVARVLAITAKWRAIEDGLVAKDRISGHRARQRTAGHRRDQVPLAEHAGDQREQAGPALALALGPARAFAEDHVDLRERLRDPRHDLIAREDVRVGTRRAERRARTVRCPLVARPLRSSICASPSALRAIRVAAASHDRRSNGQRSRTCAPHHVRRQLRPLDARGRGAATVSRSSMLGARFTRASHRARSCDRATASHARSPSDASL